jgi:hypothetical protein
MPPEVTVVQSMGGLMKRLLFVWVLCLILGDGMAIAQKSEPILVGYGRDAKWSPGETSISLIRNDTLYVTRLDSTHRTYAVHSGPILKYEWLNDSTLATQERYDIPVKDGRIFVEKIVSVSLNREAVEMAKDSFSASTGQSRRLNLAKFSDGVVGYFDNNVSGTMPVKLTSRQAVDTANTAQPRNLFVGSEPYPSGKVWLYYGSHDMKRQVTLSENHYLLPRLAPSQDKLFCKAERGDLVVFDTLGKELTNLGRASMPSWDGRGEYITFCNTEYSEYDLKSGDVFVVKYDGTERRKLTSTPDIIEYEPSFSPSSRYIMYTDYGNDALYILRVE